MTWSIVIPTVNLGRDHLTTVLPRSIILLAQHSSSGRAEILTILNAMIKHQTPWQAQEEPIA